MQTCSNCSSAVKKPVSAAVKQVICKGICGYYVNPGVTPETCTNCPMFKTCSKCKNRMYAFSSTTDGLCDDCRKIEYPARCCTHCNYVFSRVKTNTSKICDDCTRISEISEISSTTVIRIKAHGITHCELEDEDSDIEDDYTMTKYFVCPSLVESSVDKLKEYMENLSDEISSFDMTHPKNSSYEIIFNDAEYKLVKKTRHMRISPTNDFWFNISALFKDDK